MSPLKSDDLTTAIEQHGDAFVVLRSPETAGHDPNYREMAIFATRDQAENFVATKW
jgi:hypothetical protein